MYNDAASMVGNRSHLDIIYNVGHRISSLKISRDNFQKEIAEEYIIIIILLFKPGLINNN